MEEKKPIYWMILFGISRHILGIVGTWLAARGLIDADTHERLLSEGATQLVGYTLMLLPIVWSVLQKAQVWGWVTTALRRSSSNTTAAEIPQMAAGPSLPL